MSTVPAGFLQPSNLWGVYNNLNFVIQQALSKVQTASVVRVDACTNDGGLTPVGTVDVTILVNQQNGQGNPTPHVSMYGLPYLRVQGGSNAVILDPQVGDIGIAVFASRDITNVKSTKAQANPGSFRMHDFSDGMYLGGLLNGIPTQFVQFSSTGISIVSPTAITVSSPTVSAENGGNAEALVNDTFFQWFQTNIVPFLVGLGYTGPEIPAGSETTVLKGQ